MLAILYTRDFCISSQDDDVKYRFLAIYTEHELMRLLISLDI